MSKLTRGFASFLSVLFTLGLVVFGQPAAASYECEFAVELGGEDIRGT